MLNKNGFSSEELTGFALSMREASNKVSFNKEVIDKAKSNRKRKIVSTMILVEWNDSPKMETLFHEMPSDLQQSFDDWISDIEEEVQS